MLGQPALPLWLESRRNPTDKDLGTWRTGGQRWSLLHPNLQTLQREAACWKSGVVERLIFRWTVQLPSVMQQPKCSPVLYTVCTAWKRLPAHSEQSSGAQPARCTGHWCRSREIWAAGCCGQRHRLSGDTAPTLRLVRRCLLLSTALRSQRAADQLGVQPRELERIF